jgi:hypothetical protein
VLVYRPNNKQKSGASGDGPPQWFPDADTHCPDDLDEGAARRLLEGSVQGIDDAHPDRGARYGIDRQGRFFKGYCDVAEDGTETWRGYPVRDGRVREQIPASVLRGLVLQGSLAPERYLELIGRTR